MVIRSTLPRVGLRRKTRARPAWLEYVGVGYVLLALFVTLNVVLVAWGPPAPRIAQWLVQEGRLPGAGGWEYSVGPARWSSGLLPGEVSCRDASGRWSRPWLRGSAPQRLDDGPRTDAGPPVLVGGVGSVGVAVAGALISFDVLRPLMVGLGWFFGWGSVLAAVSDLVFGWPTVLIGDSPGTDAGCRCWA